MKRVLSSAVVVASLVFILGGASSWGGPPNPTQSDEYGNTAGGTGALQQTPSEVGFTGRIDSRNNTAFGDQALESNSTGNGNTAAGAGALAANRGHGALDSYHGGNNTAIGVNALIGNLLGYDNTASGAFALYSNTEGYYNTAGGTRALYSNTDGYLNTAYGAWALNNNNGLGNSALGASALSRNSSGNENTACGAGALLFNTTGNSNTAGGAGALRGNTAGSTNTALGYFALYNSTAGSRNLALGFHAGYNLTSGDKNIYLGSTGAARESNTLRLGQGQTSTFIAGISGTPLTGSMKQVFVNSGGQVGILASSARYKRDVQDMGTGSQGLHQLRPVTFRYKQDPQGQQQYGLIAEEVATVYPELVTKGADGKVESVQYHELIPMLLNEVQHQQREIEELKARLERLEPGLAHAR